MKIERFEDIIAWQKAKSLTLDIYRIFREHQDFGFKNQITRAVVSIMNNIAEGFERRTNSEFRNFLFIAKGSCGEVRSMIQVAKELQYISVGDFSKVHQLSLEISRLISGLIKTL